MNSLGVGVNQAYAGVAKIPRYIFESFGVPQNLLADAVQNAAGEDILSGIRTNGTEFDTALNYISQGGGSLYSSPLTNLDKLGDFFQGRADDIQEKQTRYDQGIYDSITSGNLSDAGAQIVNNIAQSIPSMLTMAATSGAANSSGLGTLTKTALNTLPFASSKANEIRDDQNIPESIKPIYSGLYGLAEVIYDQSFGTQAMLEKVLSTATRSGRDIAEREAKDFATGYLTKAFSKIKEPLTDVGRNAIEEMATTFSQNVLDKLVVDPNKDLMDGVLDAGIVGGAMGAGFSAVNMVMKPSVKTAIQEKNTQIEALSQDLDNPNIDDATKEVILDRVGEIKNEINNDITKEQESFSKLTEEAKDRALEVSAKINSIEQSLNAEGISEQSKSLLTEQLDSLNNELDVLVSESDVVESKEDAYNKEKERISKITDLEKRKSEEIKLIMSNLASGLGESSANKVSEYVDRILNGTETREQIIEGLPQSFVEGIDTLLEARSERPNQLVQEEKITVNKPTDVSVGETLELIDGKTGTVTSVSSDSITMELSNGATFTANPKVVEIFKTQPAQTSIQTNEVVTAPNLAPNEEISVQENIEVPVVEETAPNEVLTKAETDLEALKKVNNKIDKYKASIKRLTDAFREGRISEQEFNDTKDRFDDVIAESLPNLPKTDNISIQEVSALNQELENDDITVNDIIDYEKSNATEQLINEAENVPEAVQGRADERKADAGQNKAGEGVSVEEGKASEKAATEPKQSDQTVGQDEVGDFNSLLNQKLPSRETRETRSNVERETGDRLSQQMKEFEGVDFAASLDYGDRVVQQSKVEYGNDYVSKLTEKVKGSDMTIDKKAIILVSLENDLRKQLLENPKSTKLRKQVDMATKETIELLRTAGRGTAVGIFRQAARANYNIEEAAKAIFSDREIADRKKVEDAVFATSEDVQAEYEAQHKSGALDATIQAEIEQGVEQRINEIYESLPSRRRQQADKAIKALDNIQKRLRTKTYDASIGIPIAIIDAGISTIKAAIRAGVSVADAVELGITKIKEQYGKAWEKEGEFRQDMLNGFEQEGIDSKAQRQQQDALKQALVDAGYGKEITVNTKNGKEKRNIVDWKKLTGTEGSFETLSDNLSKLKDKGYSEAEIADIQQQLEEEYNDLHASIIQKSLNELNRRNAPKEGKQKILARRLAELYNLGLYDTDNVNEYHNIINNALGFSTQSQEAFNEIRKLNESLSRLLDSRDDNGNKLSDLALSSLETQVKNHIQKVIQKAQFAEGNGFFKTSVILKNVFSAMQRMMLATIGQLVENPFSGKLNDFHVALQDAFSKKQWDKAELREHRKQLARVMYKDAALYQGDEYGGVGNPFTSKNAIEDFVNGITDTDGFKKVAKFLGGQVNVPKFQAAYQAFMGSLSGRQYLDAADSYFKIKRTEKEFTHNLIRILTDSSNPNGAMTQQDALQYVSKIITGQSFEDAKNVARRIIANINEHAGKELIRTSETNVIRIANDLVKDSLVSGNRMSAQEVESAFKAGYRTAGKSIGHEANNILTLGLTKFNQFLEQEYKQAIKSKQWSSAALYNMTNILLKNIVFPFVGGGTNWTVIGLQKMGLPTEWINPNVGFSNRPIDLSTREGLKELEKNLAANATRQRMYGRVVIGTFTALAAILALKASGKEDEYEKWLRKHPNIKKLVYKIQPVWLSIYMALDNMDELLTALLEVIGRRKNYDEFKIKRAAENFYDGYKKGSEKKVSKAWGEMGELVGRRFNVPYLQSINSYGTSGSKIYKEFTGKYKKEKPTKSNGFVEGYFQNGLFDFMMGNEDDKK